MALFSVEPHYSWNLYDGAVVAAKSASVLTELYIYEEFYLF